MKKEFESYGDIRYTLEEMRDNLEVVIRDCKKSAKEEEDRICDDAREARYYAEFLERLMKENSFNAGDRQTLELVIFWLTGIAKRKEELP